MRAAVVVFVFLSLFATLLAEFSAPRVQVYSRTPGQVGITNTLICHASCFYPPQITIKLLENGNEFPNSIQTDQAFEENWQYHMTKSVLFTPTSGKEYICTVTHLGKSTSHVWVPDM